MLVVKIGFNFLVKRGFSSFLVNFFLPYTHFSALAVGTRNPDFGYPFLHFVQKALLKFLVNTFQEIRQNVLELII